MIDRPTRDRLAENLRHLASGTISPSEFEWRGESSDDDSIYDIEYEMFCSFYGDDLETCFRGSHRLERDERRSIARCILFLKSNNEYEWPTRTGLGGIGRSLLSFFTLGRVNLNNPPDGESAVWPFYRRADYEKQLALNPFSAGDGAS